MLLWKLPLEEAKALQLDPSLKFVTNAAMVPFVTAIAHFPCFEVVRPIQFTRLETDICP